MASRTYYRARLWAVVDCPAGGNPNDMKDRCRLYERRFRSDIGALVWAARLKYMAGEDYLGHVVEQLKGGQVVDVHRDGEAVGWLLDD